MNDPLITSDEALDLVIRWVTPLATRLCSMAAARSLLLAEDIVADADYPPFPRSMMDGFAVRLADAGKSVPVIGEIPAGATWDGTLVNGTSLAILTGAPCPLGTEAVVPKEQTRQEGTYVVLPAPLSPDQNIANPGSECRQGDRVLAAGTRVTPLAIGALSAFGRKSVRVVPRPRLGILTTGGELVEEAAVLHRGQIRDSNGPMLAAMTEECGIDTPRHLHARDDLHALRRALEQLADVDIVVLTGGVSVGTYDFVPQALADIGAEKVFHGVKQKPGKPMLFARTDRQIFFGLPGNSLACHLGFHRYVSAAIRKMSGSDARCRHFSGELTSSAESKGDRTHFVPGWAELPVGSPATWRLTPLPARSSADIFRACGANCYIEVPPLNRSILAGETCDFTGMICDPVKGFP
jgi:molybdopterin molybdotransferase